MNFNILSKKPIVYSLTVLFTFNTYSYSEQSINNGSIQKVQNNSPCINLIQMEREQIGVIKNIRNVAIIDKGVNSLISILTGAGFAKDAVNSDSSLGKVLNGTIAVESGASAYGQIKDAVNTLKYTNEDIQKREARLALLEKNPEYCSTNGREMLKQIVKEIRASNTIVMQYTDSLVQMQKGKLIGAATLAGIGVVGLLTAKVAFSYYKSHQDSFAKILILGGGSALAFIGIGGGGLIALIEGYPAYKLNKDYDELKANEEVLSNFVKNNGLE